MGGFLSGPIMAGFGLQPFSVSLPVPGEPGVFMFGVVRHGMKAGLLPTQSLALVPLRFLQLHARVLLTCGFNPHAYNLPPPVISSLDFCRVVEAVAAVAFLGGVGQRALDVVGEMLKHRGQKKKGQSLPFQAKGGGTGRDGTA